MEKAAVESVIAQVREKFGAIRHPATGEFPTIFAVGDSLKTLQMRVEGSAELLAIVKERYTSDDLPIEFVTRSTAAPKVFLSYAWEDRILAEKIAIALQSSGIETWWAEWCIAAGDSLRQKIDAGLSECSHFVVLLTPESIQKPWVNQEMDAGLVRRLSQRAKFIPLRHGLEPALLPALLTGMLSPEVDARASNIQQLINDIHGLTRKPPLGQAPKQGTSAVGTETGYSAAANAIAEVFVKGSSGGCLFDPQVQVEDMMKQTGLSAEDVVDAMHELSSLAVLHRGELTWPKEELFSEFDKFWMPWDPAKDALQLAADVVNAEGFPEATEDIATHYGWEARRLNPAITYLATRGAMRTTRALSARWVSIWIQKTDAMRRFVKSRS
ncbi:toll/interleukin-1 receptor domain-containing protein [Curvibacter sp. AEP1-3]|uniref:toll/interleukin-1 receptor domain-containing protein n=1 Tax=Curvibacter sp. AEP1-3 TaxID=1844971 RepID=UPI0018DFAAB0|nr:toll/interleukin-1 receptor domain-containing protein [Curvibacter sp. AEP1-3]